MTRTIDERIEILLDHLDGITMQKNTLCRNMIRAAFAEPWLDAPDGPGWWFVKNMADKTAVIEYDPSDAMMQKLITLLPEVKWQRAIVPSELHLDPETRV